MAIPRKGSQRSSASGLQLAAAESSPHNYSLMPPSVAERIDQAGGAWDALVGVIRGLGDAGRITRASTSAGIHNAETDARFPGSGGEHLYVIVADGSDIPRALSERASSKSGAVPIQLIGGDT
jgi:hypothetical protein